MVRFDCSFVLFGAGRTIVDVLNWSLLYSLISFQVSLLSTLSVAPESNHKINFNVVLMLV